MKIVVKKSKNPLRRQRFYLRITHSNGEPLNEMFLRHSDAVDSANAIASAKEWRVVDESSLV